MSTHNLLKNKKVSIYCVFMNVLVLYHFKIIHDLKSQTFIQNYPQCSELVIIAESCSTLRTDINWLKMNSME